MGVPNLLPPPDTIFVSCQNVQTFAVSFEHLCRHFYDHLVFREWKNVLNLLKSYISVQVMQSAD